jgi:hypothetical protein
MKLSTTATNQSQLIRKVRNAPQQYQEKVREAGKYSEYEQQPDNEYR